MIQLRYGLDLESIKVLKESEKIQGGDYEVTWLLLGKSQGNGRIDIG